MTVKTNGAEWKRFYNDPEYWPDGVWHEEEELLVNGVECTDSLMTIADTAIVSISGGVVYVNETEDIGSLESYFRRWRKAQATATLVVAVPKEQVETILAAVKTAGGKVK